MNTAKMIEELREALARATQGPWVIKFDGNKEPLICTAAGAVVMERDSMALEDVALVVSMYRNLPALLDALEAKEAERLAAVIAMERANNEHMATLRKTIAEMKEHKAGTDRAMSLHNELTGITNRMERELVSARAKLDRQEPLIAAVETWVRTRHSPRLLAAWTAYQQVAASCVKTSS